MGAEVISLAARVAIVSIIGRGLGAEALAGYLLLARVTAWFLAGTVLGLGVALPRYIAFTVGSRRQDPTRYFQAASICLMISSIGMGLIMVAFRHTFASWLFGDGRRTAFVVALALMLWGLAAHTAVYGYYQGLLAMGRANLLEVCTGALVPLSVVIGLGRTHSVPLMVGTMGCLDIACSALFALQILRRAKVPRLSEMAGNIMELLRYGIPRVSGDFGAAALTALGPVIAAHYLPIEKLSAFLLGQTMLMVTGYAFGSLEVVLLSKVSMMLGQDRQDEVRRRLEHLVAGIFEVSVFVSIQLVIFADVAVRLWVGQEFLGGVHVIRLLLLAIPPYLFYTAFRATIDAATVKPLNAANVLIGLTIYLPLIGVSARILPVQHLLEGLAGSLLIALIVLGTLTFWRVRKLYGLRVIWRRSVPPLMAALGLGGAAYIFRWIHSFGVHPVQVVLLEVGLTSAYLAMLTSLRSGWLHYIWERTFAMRKSWNLPLLRWEVKY